jgi:mRNA interferase RelE/StbE
VTYAVFLHPKAAKELKKLEARTRARINERTGELRKNPIAAVKNLSQSGFWSLGVGDHRVSYEINHDKKQVVILFVGHRSKVYDDFSKMI